MLNSTSLFHLASGRLTPLSRIALFLVFGLLIALVLLVEPVHQAAQPLVPVRASILALESGSAWVERAELEEGSSMFMPMRQESVVLTDTAQPDAAPFSAFGPEYRHDPAKPLALSSEVVPVQWKGLDQAFPVFEDRVFATLGEKPVRPAPGARKLHILVYSDINETVIEREFSGASQEDSKLKLLIDSGLNVNSPIELRLGIDAMGLHSRPYLVRSSGDDDWDRAVSSWARTLPWATWLKPGSYRVVVGP